MPCLSGSKHSCSKKPTWVGEVPDCGRDDNSLGGLTLFVSCGCVAVRRGTNRKVCLGIVCGPTSRVRQLVFFGGVSGVLLLRENRCACA